MVLSILVLGFIFVLTLFVLLSSPKLGDNYEKECNFTKKTNEKESKGVRVLTEHIQHIVESDAKKSKLTDEEVKILDKIIKKPKRKKN